MRNAVFTSCNLSYIDRAMVLAKTIKKHYKDCDIVLMISDYVDQDLFDNQCFSDISHIVDTSTIGIPNFIQWSFQYDVVELCTAVKGYCFKYLFGLGYTKVIYLDPDIACFNSIGFLFDLLDGYSILLTPHQLKPAKYKIGVIDNELCSHKHGIFNLGFLGLSSSGEAKDFLSWWSSRLYDFCLDDLPNGIFTDQKWCDAVPSYFESYKIVRHAGCNVASWNLSERRITIFEGNAMVNDSYPLIFFHYTKYFSDGPIMTARYAQTLETIDIWNWYHLLISNIRNILPNVPRDNKYMSYSSGLPICKADRRMFRALYLAGQLAEMPNPYESSANQIMELSSSIHC